MKVSGRDVLEICEESDGDDQEHEDSDDGAPKEVNAKNVKENTVALEGTAAVSKKKKLLKKRKKQLTKREISEKRRLTHDRKLLALVKPDVTTNREKEQLLKRIATKGVVQLFNAVAERQRVLAEELSKKMTAKERRETERRLQGSAFKVYPENDSDIAKKEEIDEHEDDTIKKEEDSD
ncbi:hypothetical protein Q1695_004014 [Nippostrongylus brasiliensis]|nr:hypothetical protein Q1695_004014 [Nippostrongylus brasiliensis]